ncbi:hypothetical protein EON66_02360 [archaeon]|nr:MAG: hypothetical protein EON66_02360 [archaeon]
MPCASLHTSVRACQPLPCVHWHREMEADGACSAAELVVAVFEHLSSNVGATPAAALRSALKARFHSWDEAAWTYAKAQLLRDARVRYDADKDVWDVDRASKLACWGWREELPLPREFEIILSHTAVAYVPVRNPRYGITRTGLHLLVRHCSAFTRCRACACSRERGLALLTLPKLLKCSLKKTHYFVKRLLRQGKLLKGHMRSTTGGGVPATTLWLPRFASTLPDLMTQTDCQQLEALLQRVCTAWTHAYASLPACGSRCKNALALRHEHCRHVRASCSTTHDRPRSFAPTTLVL